MTVVTAPTALTVAGPAGTRGAAVAEQNGDTTNGNKFVNAPGTLLLVRNTTISAITIDVYADIQQTECVLLDNVSIPGSGTNGGLAVLGPFEAKDFNNHATSITGTSAQGSVVFKQNSGSAGDLKFHPFVPNRSLV